MISKAKVLDRSAIGIAALKALTKSLSGVRMAATYLIMADYYDTDEEEEKNWY